MNVTSAVFATGMPCADSNTICARRQVTTEPLPLRMIRSRRVSSSSLILRTRTRSATRTAWRGLIATENLWRSSHRDPAAETELRRQAQQYLARREEHHPTLTRHADLGNDDFDGSFQLGLETVLDGIEARIGT